jgi:hypothetical protein
MYHLEDILILEHILESIPEPDEGSYNSGHLLVEVGKYFMEATYAGRTLEQEGPEELIINLRVYDCFTYVENCLALALFIPSRRQSWNDFTALLTKIRYRNGILNGYASRLHYFSDWLHDNVQKGYLRDVTNDLKGISCNKEINFMTKNPGLYPPLSDPAIVQEIEDVEKQMANHACHYVPVSEFDQREHRIKDGDIIGITSAEEGLDVMHAGLAIYQGEDLHLLHASQQEGRVVITEGTLGQYLRESDTRTGIMVGRLGKIS